MLLCLQIQPVDIVGEEGAGMVVELHEAVDAAAAGVGDVCRVAVGLAAVGSEDGVGDSGVCDKGQEGVGEESVGEAVCDACRHSRCHLFQRRHLGEDVDGRCQCLGLMCRVCRFGCEGVEVDNADT